MGNYRDISAVAAIDENKTQYAYLDTSDIGVPYNDFDPEA